MDGIVGILAGYVAFILALTIHEWAHAWTANLCGDPTARLMGRMTLNPLPHLDLLGTVLIPLLPSLLGLFGGAPALGFSLIGWGKPVPVNPANFRGGGRDDVFVSIAGPLSNILTTLLALALLKVLMILQVPLVHEAATWFLYMLAMISFCLAFFNMLPIPPLDGSHLLRFFLPYHGRQWYDQIARHGFILLIILVNTPVWHLISSAISALFRQLIILFVV